MNLLKRLRAPLAVLLLLAGVGRFVQNGFLPALKLSLGDFRASFPTEYFAWIRPDFPTKMVWPGWTYGPVLHFITLPLFLVPRWSMVGAAWALINLCALLASFVYVYRLSGAERRVSWAAIAVLGGLWGWFKPMQSCFEQGNIELIEMAITLAALDRVRRGRERAAGILLGTATMIKFAPVGFVAWLGLRGRWRTVTAAVLTIVAIAGLAQVTLGWQNNGLALRSLWLRGVPQINADTQTVISIFLHRVGVLDMSDAYFPQRWFPDARAATAARAGAVAGLAYTVVFGVLMFLRRKREWSPLEVSSLFLPMILLPTSNHQYYFVFALVPLSVLFLRSVADRQWGVLTATMVTYFMISAPFRFTWIDLASHFEEPFFYVLNYHSVMAYGALTLWGIATYQMLSEPGGAVDAPSFWKPGRRLASAALIVMAIGASGAWWWRGHVQRWSPSTTVDHSLAAGLLMTSPASLAVSPDGTRVAYISPERRLCVRSIEDSRETCWTDADDPDHFPLDPSSPFFSPDGKWLGFLSRGGLRRAPVGGGVLEPINGVPPGTTPSWPRKDMILMSTPAGILRTTPTGDSPTVVIERHPDEGAYYSPVLLPAGDAVVFTIAPTGKGHGAGTLVVQSLTTGRRKVIGPGSQPKFDISSGRLLFASAGHVMAVPMDLTSLDVDDVAFPVVTDVRVTPEDGALFDVSANGSIVYVPQTAEPASPRQLVWVDRKGETSPLPLSPAPFDTPKLSPDGKLLAFSIRNVLTDIWVYDFATGLRRRIAADANRNETPVWMGDGRTVFFSASGSPATGPMVLSTRSEDGGRIPTTHWTPGLLDREVVPRLTSSTPDGKVLVGSRGAGLWWVDTAHDNRVTEVVSHGPSDLPTLTMRSPAISPDGKWIAYSANRTAKSEIYVQPFPAMNAEWQVSNNGGVEPLWSHDGTELFYRGWQSPSNVFGMLSVSVNLRGTFSAGTPQVLFLEPTVGGSLAGYDVTADGRRFVMIRRVPSRAAAPLRVVRHWVARLPR